ncbi:hypothetical protein E2C01_089105 [Portunus trituberculatus]|uniref:Uncharacterized protein n=1 Tax=Portunus trituberculatus TaxID=210409 RepID=A0A5B7JLB8_PORTR|nr:hypothetical protein [Portunus trituberculatus]
MSCRLKTHSFVSGNVAARSVKGPHTGHWGLVREAAAPGRRQSRDAKSHHKTRHGFSSHRPPLGVACHRAAEEQRKGGVNSPRKSLGRGSPAEPSDKNPSENIEKTNSFLQQREEKLWCQCSPVCDVRRVARPSRRCDRHAPQAANTQQMRPGEYAFVYGRASLPCPVTLAGA